MKIINKINDSSENEKRVIYVIEIETNVFVDVVQKIDDNGSYFFYVLDESAYKRNELNEINAIYNYIIDENKLYNFLNKAIK